MKYGLVKEWIIRRVLPSSNNIMDGCGKLFSMTIAFLLIDNRFWKKSIFA